MSQKRLEELASERLALVNQQLALESQIREAKARGLVTEARRLAAENSLLIARLTELKTAIRGGRAAPEQQRQAESETGPTPVPVISEADLTDAQSRVAVEKERANRAERLAQSEVHARRMAEDEAEGLRLRIQSLEAALEASRERRRPLLTVCRLLVTAEDNIALSDDEYDGLVTAAAKLARTQLALEKAQEARTTTQAEA